MLTPGRAELLVHLLAQAQRAQDDHNYEAEWNEKVSDPDTALRLMHDPDLVVGRYVYATDIDRLARRSLLEMRRRLCDYFRALQQRRVEVLKRRIKEKEDALRRREEEKHSRIRMLEDRIAEIRGQLAALHAQQASAENTTDDAATTDDVAASDDATATDEAAVIDDAAATDDVGATDDASSEGNNDADA